MHLIFLIMYIIMILAVALISRKNVHGLSEFFLGGRSVNPWMSAFSYGTAYFSAVFFIGYAGKVCWNFGISAAWIVAGNTIIGSYLAWEILGKKTREMTHRLNVSTMPQFISCRYQSKALKIVTAIIIFVFLIPYSASVYKGLGYLFEEIFNIPNHTALLIMTVLTATYLFLGGFIAATLADFIQGIVMIIGIILLVFFVLRHPTVGGVNQAFHTLKQIDPLLVDPFNRSGMSIILSFIVLTSFGTWGLPQMVHKFYTIRSEKHIFCAKWVSTVFALLITLGVSCTGIMSRLFFPTSIPSINGQSNPDMIVPQMIDQAVPEWVAGIILVLVLSASMSTLASLVLSSSSAISLDLIEGVFFPNIDKKLLMLLTRILCVVFVICSFWLAISPNAILSLASLSWGAVSGCLLAPYLLGLYWEKATKAGVWAGIITALGLVLGSAAYFGVNDPRITLVSAVAVCVPFIVVPIVSLVTLTPNTDHLQFIFNKNVKTEV